MNSSSSPNLAPSAPQPPINPFLAPPVLPGPPGLPVVGSSSPALQVQPLPAYPPLYPAMNASPQPQGLWLQPHPMVAAGVPPRPLYLPYNPAVFPAPFSVATLAAPPPAISVPDSRPPAALELPPGIDAKNQVQEVGGKDNASLMSGEEASPNAWTAHRTETGVVYYYNAVTGVSTYEKPPGFKGEPEKVHVQPTPVSMENLAGTDWALITTNDGKTYYYNAKTKLSSWQIPGEVTEFRKKQEAEISTDQRASVYHTSISSESGAAPITLSAPAVATGGREASGLRVSSFPGSTSALDLIKRKLQDTGSPHTASPTAASLGTMVPELNGSRVVDDAAKGFSSENNKDIPKDSNGDGNASDSSSDSEDEENGPTKEDCVIQFKEMLKERGVAPFSKWEKELPKIVFDPRFQAMPSHSARRSLFEHYVKTRAEEERKEKRAAQKAAIEGFKQLLEEASEDIHHNTDYHTLKKKWGNDPRFDALDRKDREHLLNERILPLKKAAQEKAQAEHAAAAASFKSMLRDKGDITVNSRWSRVKDILRDDPRYKSVKHEDREVLFNEYLSELKASEEEAEREAKARKEEQEKLKERERELRKRKEREEQEMERVRLKIRRKDAVASFQALLVETIKDPQASWTESKPKLEKDPQGRATHPDLDPSETEKFFREHVKMLYERCVNDFKALLTEVITPEAAAEKTEDGKTVLDSWSTAKRLLKPHPRYNKMPRKERELLWRRHAEEMQRKQKLALDTKEDRHADPKGKGSTYSGESKRSSNRK